MKKVLCAVLFAVVAAGSAMAADDALTGLKASVSPLALEDSVPPVPVAPAPVEPAAVVEVTKLDAVNIQGEYIVLVKMENMPPMQMLYADNKSTLTRKRANGDVLVCEGTYKLDLQTETLVTDLPDCGGSALVYTMFLKGQTLESLTAGVNARGTLKMDGDVTPEVNVGIKKIK